MLGVSFAVLLALSSIENTLLFQNVNATFFTENPLLAVGILFMNNVLVASLILVGMTFYVGLVLNFFVRGRYERIVLEYPKTFALVFSVMILFLSILRGASILQGGVNVQALPMILLVSAPVGIVEGYGIYLTLKKTLGRTMSMRGLAFIYGIFFFAAILEVAFTSLLVWVTIA
jgi:hypothetical protein